MQLAAPRHSKQSRGCLVASLVALGLQRGTAESAHVGPSMPILLARQFTFEPFR